MKKLSIILGLIFSVQAFAADTTLICNDQNSHAVYRLLIKNDLTSVKLITVIGDSGVLSAGTRELGFEEGESSETQAAYSGKSNAGLIVALSLNSKKAISLEQNEILDVSVYYQPSKGDILSGKTTLLCSKK